MFLNAIPTVRAPASSTTPRLNRIHRKRDTLSLSVSMAVGCGVSSCCFYARRCASSRRCTRTQKRPNACLLLMVLSSETDKSSMDHITCVASHGTGENACLWKKKEHVLSVIRLFLSFSRSPCQQRRSFVRIVDESKRHPTRLT